LAHVIIVLNDWQRSRIEILLGTQDETLGSTLENFFKKNCDRKPHTVV
jgi:hypothetical protein